LLSKATVLYQNKKKTDKPVLTRKRFLLLNNKMLRHKRVYNYYLKFIGLSTVRASVLKGMPMSKLKSKLKVKPKSVAVDKKRKIKKFRFTNVGGKPVTASHGRIFITGKNKKLLALKRVNMRYQNNIKGLTCNLKNKMLVKPKSKAKSKVKSKAKSKAKSKIKSKAKFKSKFKPQSKFKSDFNLFLYNNSLFYRKNIIYSKKLLLA